MHENGLQANSNKIPIKGLLYVTYHLLMLCDSRQMLYLNKAQLVDVLPFSSVNFPLDGSMCEYKNRPCNCRIETSATKLL